jgi:hypothetical protein
MKCDRRGGRRTARFVFENGEVCADAYDITVRTASGEGREYDFSDLRDKPPHAGADRAMTDDFISSVSGGLPLRCGIADALRSHAICICDSGV